MTNHSSDRAVVQSVVGLRIKERRLKNAGRKNNLIVCRLVIRIHGGWSHGPFGSVGWFPDFIQTASRLESKRLARIFEVGVASEANARIVPPFVRIADLASNRVEFRQRLLLCRF